MPNTIQNTDPQVAEKAAIWPLDEPGQPGPEYAEEGTDEVEEVSEDTEYSISAIPNDFNIATLCNFLESGTISIPSFQRAFVWTKAKASRFIESLALGLPVPQLFLYQPVKDIRQDAPLWIVDGQQRLLSIYYFSKGRFPRAEKTVEISRKMSNNQIKLSQATLDDESLFTDFSLSLNDRATGETRRLHGYKYEDFGDRFPLRAMRTVVIQQFKPDNSAAAFEIFDRLNTGGTNLSWQQIRSCIYDSPFIRSLNEMNLHPEWRSIVGTPPAGNSQDTEVILRALALLADGEAYKYPLHRFLNKFCEDMRDKSEEDVVFLRDLFHAFVRNYKDAVGKSKRDSRFRIALFEGVFVASLRDCYLEKRLPNLPMEATAIEKLARDGDFEAASQKRTTSVANVRIRLDRAVKIIKPV